MGRKKRKADAEKKRKKITVDVVSREHGGKTTKLYKIMDSLIAKHHKHLADAAIAIGWRYDKKQDADGRLWLGSLKKASDLDRKLHQFDFVMLLNHEFCNKAATDQQITALVDHELCHGQVSYDAHGERKEDGDGRGVYRIRKHDVEEFQEIVVRHGAWKGDLEKFFGAWKDKHDLPIIAEAEKNAAKKKKTGRTFSEPAHGSTVDPAAPINGAPDAWKADGVDVLDVSAATKRILKRCGYETIGLILEYENQPGIASDSSASLYMGGQGLGAPRGVRLREAMANYISNHAQQPAAAT